MNGFIHAFVGRRGASRHVALACGIMLLLVALGCKTSAPRVPKYAPSDQALFTQIAAMDKVFFDAYNGCDLKLQEEIYADEIEFFHDKGGLINSKAAILQGTKDNICGKVTRHLVAGSIEVYPIHDYGAVEMGFHWFFNNQEPDAASVPSKFIIVWKQVGAEWRITKVVSLH